MCTQILNLEVDLYFSSFFWYAFSMIQRLQPYFDRLKNTLKAFGETHPQSQIFLFGSSIQRDRFGDIDIGIMGKNVEDSSIADLQEQFEQSSFPFLVDIVNFNTVREPFRSHVLKQPVLWIQH